MRLTIAFLLSVFILGCQDDGQVKTCTDEAHCVGHQRVYCDGDELKTEDCSPAECSAGTCQPICDETGFETYCEGQTVVSCKAGKYVGVACLDDQICQNGACHEQADCDETSFKAHCQQDKLVSCKAGEIVEDACAKGQTCIVDTCKEIPIHCGDGQIDAGTEICDDGLDNGSYGKCRSDCQSISSCGDGIIDAPSEYCDDGLDNGSYGKCRSDCQSISSCGDGIIDLGEECDPPSKDWLKECHDDCSKAVQLFPDRPFGTEIDFDGDALCQEDDLMAKYMHYRKRFLGDAQRHIPGFVSWGEGAGESLPASRRDPISNCQTMWNFNHSPETSCDFKDLPDAQGSYHWGDTTIWLGVMVHWLATEYRMFKILGVDTSETEHYIALSMKAFDRLDKAAELMFGLSPVLDGFFLRDDLPRDFYLKDGKYRFARQDGVNKGYECAGSSGACERYKNIDPKEFLEGGGFVSQDQITGIFEGYGMLAKFIPDDLEVDGIKIRQHARATIDRMMRLAKNRSWLLGIEFKGKWLQIPDAWGGYLVTFSGVFAEATNDICGSDFGTDDYHDGLSQASLAVIKTMLPTMWAMWETINNYNRNLIIRMLVYTKVWDAKFFEMTAVESGRDPQAFSRALYWDEDMRDDFPLWRTHHILATAPCDGPCSGASCKEERLGWMGESYFISPNERYGAKHERGEYNGLDYLIMHNLYFLAYAKKTGHAYAQVLPKVAGNAGALAAILNAEADPKAYDLKAKANESDLNMTFCGRTFGDWVRDNALGLVDIYTGKTRWNCEMSGKCTLAQDELAYTHRNALILGTKNADTLTIPAGYHHCVASLGGNDDIRVGKGSHVIEAGDGADTIRTNGGHVFVYGGAGNDNIILGSGFHQVDAGDGDDIVTGGSGTNLLFGGAGNDILNAGIGSNALIGGSGNDLMTAEDGDNTVWASEGRNKIKLGNGNNKIFLLSGRNFVFVGNGNNGISSDDTKEELNICFGSGKNVIWAGWTGFGHCSAAQNSELNGNSCHPDLTPEFCSLSNFDAWQ